MQDVHGRRRLGRSEAKSWAGAVAGALLLGMLLSARAASAFCGFYVAGADAKLFNNASLVVMMRDGTTTVLSMQNNYQGPAEDFAMVVPVPVVLEEKNVKTLPDDVFERVDRLSAPRLVEYWEQDPCAPEPPRMMALGGRAPSAMVRKSSRGASLGVTIEAQFSVGEYDVVVLSAKDSSGLDTWLRQEKYEIPEGSEEVLRPYVAQGMKFFVAKVDTSKVTFKGGQAMLSPLRFHFDAKTFSLPVRLGLLNSQGKQDLIVHILARGQRYEVANYDNVTIPTNLDVKTPTKEEFGTFYTALFDKTLEEHPKAIVTEYSWASSSCDPCPTPPLSASDLLTLGADVIVKDAGNVMKPTSSSPSRRWIAPPPGLGSFVLTRLHARYSKDILGEDLVFRAAPPIAGGREFMNNEGKLEEGAVPADVNNFQGRYAIRHPWMGPIACENPTRGIWGGPPGGEKPEPRPATDIAFAPRGKSLTRYVPEKALNSLATLVSAGVPLGSPVPKMDLDVAPAEEAGTPETLQPVKEESPSEATPKDGTGETKAGDNKAAEPTSPPPMPPSSRGCGSCAVGSSSRGALPWLEWSGCLLLLGAAGLRLSSRRRRGKRPM